MIINWIGFIFCSNCLHFFISSRYLPPHLCSVLRKHTHMHLDTQTHTHTLPLLWPCIPPAPIPVGPWQSPSPRQYVIRDPISISSTWETASSLCWGSWGEGICWLQQGRHGQLGVKTGVKSLGNDQTSVYMGQNWGVNYKHMPQRGNQANSSLIFKATHLLVIYCHWGETTSESQLNQQSILAYCLHNSNRILI